MRLPTPRAETSCTAACASRRSRDSDEPFGDVMNSMQKYVLSNSLRSADWQNTELIGGDVAGKLTDIRPETAAI